jgi:cytochrome b6-f complex iron-sulfur subunit
MAKKKLSTAEILAAARKTDGKSGEEAPPAAAAEPAASAVQPQADTSDPPAASQAAEAGGDSTAPAEAAPSKPAKKPAAASGDRPGVADILAMARQEKAAGGAAAPKKEQAAKKEPTKKKETPAPKAQPNAEKQAAERPAVKKLAAAGPKSTASILTEARALVRPGPISKSQAAAQQTTKEKAVPQPKPAVPPMPARPASLAARPSAPPAEETRRSFFAVMFGSFLGIGFSALSATFGLWTLGLARFMFPNVLIEPPMQFKIGPPANFPPGSVDERFKATQGAWIVNDEYRGQQQIFALKSVCTHLGCTPNWLESDQKFKCPCHGSGFYRDGINFEGPAPRPLERYAISIAADGQLQVDKSRIFQEEMGQWSDPECFVPV